jgi:hypothetical protein
MCCAAALMVARMARYVSWPECGWCFDLKSGGPSRLRINKTAALQIYVTQSRSLYQRPAAGRNQGRPL